MDDTFEIWFSSDGWWDQTHFSSGRLRPKDTSQSFMEILEHIAIDKRIEKSPERHFTVLTIPKDKIKADLGKEVHEGSNQYFDAIVYLDDQKFDNIRVYEHPDEPKGHITIILFPFNFKGIRLSECKKEETYGTRD